MARSIQLYARALTTEQAQAWLRTVFADVELVRREPALTYALRSDGADAAPAPPGATDEENRNEPNARVFVAEGIEGGDYTSIWFQGKSLPWSSPRSCARSLFESSGTEVICDPDGYEDDPWRMIRVSDEGEDFIDEREVDF